MVKRSVILNVPDPAAWNAYVSQHPLGSLLQMAQWGQHKAAFGWDWEIVTAGSGNDPIGGALVLYKPLPLKLGTVAYVPRGPLVNWRDQGCLASVWEVIRQRARSRKAWALWVEPPLFDAPEARAQLRGLGLRPSSRTIQPARTILVDIRPDEDGILAQMKSKTRYNIRLAERKGVAVRPGTLEDIPIFYALMTETGARDGFGVHSEAYFRRAMELFLPTEQVVLLMAEVGEEPVAALMIFALGRTAWYFYGASSDRHRNLMPTYVLQWEAIRWAKAHGCTLYDLWGIPDADEDFLEEHFTGRSDGLWGVYRFKRGFGGRVVRYVGLWEQPLNPLYPLAMRVWNAR